MKVTALIPLPLFYNPEESGRREPVENEHFERTAEEIAKQFGGGMLWRFEDGQVRGFWWDSGAIDRDDLAMLEVDIDDTPANREKLKKYVKEVLRKRFRQKAIYVKWVGPVETWLVTEQEEIK